MIRPEIRDARPIVSLAFPVVVSQLGLMLMILVDTFMVGKLGPSILGGVGVGSAVFYGFSLFSTGILFGLEYFVSHAYGRGDFTKCTYWLAQACYLSLLLSLLTVPAIYATANALPYFGLSEEIAVPAKEYLKALSWSLPPALFFISLRQYLAAMSLVRSTAVIVLVANVANAFLNWVFIYGNWGSPAFGAVGAGISTTVTRILMLAGLVAIGLAFDDKIARAHREKNLAPDPSGMWQLASLGLPSGFQMLLRSAVFSVMATLAGRLGAIPMAAHAVVINIASFAFMIPMGVSTAASVLVGQRLGGGDTEGAGRVGWASIAIGGITMATFGLLFYGLGAPLVRVFSLDPAVVMMGKEILFLVALFQIADAVQTVATGALRGRGETRTTLTANFVGLWLVGLPLGYYFCFYRDGGIIGLWLGVTIGLFLVSLIVLRKWITLIPA